MKKTESKKVLARLRACEAPNVTYKTESFPIVLHKARGCLVSDVDGNKYFDATSFFGVAALGHRHPATLRALRKQAAHLIHGMGDVHPTATKVTLMEHLKDVSPMGKNAFVFLCQSGSEAIEYALKTAILKTKRHKFVSFQGGYHGLLMGSLGLTSKQQFRSGFEGWLKDSFVTVPFPQSDLLCGNAPSASHEEIAQNEKAIPEKICLEILERNLASHEFAAVVLEPIQSRGGVREFSDSFLKKLHVLCQRHNSLLIFDELFTGFWRTGNTFASERSVTPDLLCVGKALGGTLPLSACLGNNLDVWGECDVESRHTSTFLGHPLACAVGTESLKTLKKLSPQFIKNARDLKNTLEKFCEWYSASPLSKKSPLFLRGRGFMYGLVFRNPHEDFIAKVVETAAENGLIVLLSGEVGNVLSISPPLVTSSLDLKMMSDRLVKTFRTLEKKYG